MSEKDAGPPIHFVKMNDLNKNGFPPVSILPDDLLLALGRPLTRTHPRQLRKDLEAG